MILTDGNDEISICVDEYQLKNSSHEKLLGR